jgi:hypothetical protein
VSPVPIIASTLRGSERSVNGRSPDRAPYQAGPSS